MFYLEWHNTVYTVVEFALEKSTSQLNDATLYKITVKTINGQNITLLDSISNESTANKVYKFLKQQVGKQSIIDIHTLLHYIQTYQEIPDSILK